jgi:arginine/lysine/ornithine decarboxylase
VNKKRVHKANVIRFWKNCECSQCEFEKINSHQWGSLLVLSGFELPRRGSIGGSVERLYDKLISYVNEDFYPMHMPGHKRNTDAMNMINPYMLDITEIDGFDNLHQTEGILEELSLRISRLYGSKRAFPLVNGSTSGILAAVSAATRKGDKVLIARNAHKSVYNAVILMGLDPVYYYPHLIEEPSIFGGILGAEIEDLLINNPDIKAVIITSPTYEGIVSDIREISGIVHRHNALLIVDEAHGAHFGFNKEFPDSAVTLGADLVIQSLHKTLPSFTQTAVLHSNREELNARLQKYLAYYQSSSPSYILLAGIDRCISLLEDRSDELFTAFYKRLERFYHSISGLKNITVMDRRIIGISGVYKLDAAKLTVCVGNTDINGHRLQEILRNSYHIEMEMAAPEYALGITGICDTDEGFMRMSAALYDIDRNCVKPLKSDSKAAGNISRTVIKPEQILLPCQAAEYETEIVNIKECIGRISASCISLFPPGCPLIIPGERLDYELIDYIRQIKQTGITITGLAGENKDGIEIVKFDHNTR